MSTSTATGTNSGNGSLTITEYPAATVYAPYFPTSSPGQYLLDGVTQLNRGSSTTQGGVTFGAMLDSSGTLGVQFQVEAEPIGKNFTNIPNVTSTPFMTPNQSASTTFYGPNGGYHWQAQIVDVFGNTSGWQRFSSSTYVTDFALTAPAVTLVTNATETYTGSVSSFTVPSDVAKLVITAYGAQGAASSTTQQPGGLGGEVSYTMRTIPGTTFYYRVGGQGGSPVGAGDMTWVSPVNSFSTSTVWRSRAAVAAVRQALAAAPVRAEPVSTGTMAARGPPRPRRSAALAAPVIRVIAPERAAPGAAVYGAVAADRDLPLTVTAAVLVVAADRHIYPRHLPLPTRATFRA